MKNFQKNNLYLIFILLLSLPSVLALLHKGFYGASDDLHVAWLFEMNKILSLGQIPPRFVPDLSFGFGYPLFNFVFPLPFYIGQIFHSIGFTLVGSVKFVFGISLLASALSMFKFLKAIISKELALAGALLYVYAPYRATDVYVRGALGESLAFVFLPLILLSIVKIYKGKNEIEWKNIGIFSFGLASLILSHNIVSYMFFPFVLLLILILFLSAKHKINFLLCNFMGVVGGLLASIYFWLPAIKDSSLMKYETVFNFVDHFPTLKQLITPYFGYGASVPGPYDGMSFFVGLFQLITIGIGIFLSLILWKKLQVLEKTILLWSLMVLLISIFMMNFRSSYLWSNLPFLPYFQFPWRFLTIITLIAPIFLISFNHFKSLHKYFMAVVISVGVIFLNFNNFKPHDFLEREDAYYINRYIPTPVASGEYVSLQEEYLRLPKQTEKRPDKNYPILFADTKFNYEVEYTDGLNAVVKIQAPEDLLVNYNKYNFPGWRAKLNGDNVEILTGRPFGQVAVKIPQGEYKLELGFYEPKYKLILDIISFMTIISLVYLATRKK